MNNIELAEGFAKMWRDSRTAAGKSQEYMAKALNVSKKTVQNWEAGTSCPSQITGLQWFKILGIQPMPYYFELLFPEEYSKGADVDDILIDVVKSLSPKTKRELLYFFTGKHGSSPLCVLEMVTAYLQTPLEFRLNVATGIALNYEVAEARGVLKNPADITPNMALVYDAINKGREAVVKNLDDYTIL